ncbi:S-layer homology domain-containing protein [Candidatus Peregrinibacteria bacterium]|nr:MAG: S-layer homology domain-containing protein [Candidatus Peregrinibacteria bacterium]
MKRFLFLFFAFVLMTLPAQAAVDVTAVDLQNASQLMHPDGASLETLSGFSGFYYRDEISVFGGTASHYQALLLNDPWLSSGLPEVQLRVLAYADQEAADVAFEKHQSSSRFNEEDLSLLTSNSHAIFYTKAEGGSAVDLLQSVSADSSSFHWLEKNGNVLIQASLYLSDGSIHEDTLRGFSSLEQDEIFALLSNAADLQKVSLGLLFPPENPFFSAQTEGSSRNLNETYELPLNGSLSLDIYVSDPAAAVGTVLDSSGLLSATDGDLYLYITKEGKLLAGLYAPYYDADCVQTAGWYSVGTTQALYPYEWNHVTLRYGVGGFGLSLNDAAEVYCSVSQARSGRALHMGDYPSDSLSEGMIGVVDHIEIDFSLDSLGRRVDSVLASQLFLDLSPTDPDFEVFEFLKAEKVFLGSDGFLRADSALNRAAMVKVLLRAFDYGTSSASVSFSDVSSTAWYKKYLAKAVEIGMVKGHDNGTFGGGDFVTRAEFFTMLKRLDTTFKSSETEAVYSDVKAEVWYEEGAYYAHTHGFVEGPYFYPTQMVTRREAAQVLYELLQ